MNYVKHAEKLSKFVEERGLGPDCIRHLGYAEVVPLIEAASYEENDEVHDLWAGLLVNALDPNSDVAIGKVFVALLKEIGPAEARLLRLVHQYGTDGDIHRTLPHNADALNAVLQWRADVEDSVRKAAIVNLRRLGCLAPSVSSPDLMGIIEYEGYDEGIPYGERTINIAHLEEELSGLVWAITESLLSEDLPPGPDMLALRAIEDEKICVSELGLKFTALGYRLMDATFHCPSVQGVPK